jgi:hypothetical protein
MPTPGWLELIVIIAITLVFIAPLYLLIRGRGTGARLDRIERKLDDIDRRLP